MSPIDCTFRYPIGYEQVGLWPKTLEPLSIWTQIWYQSCLVQCVTVSVICNYASVPPPRGKLTQFRNSQFWGLAFSKSKVYAHCTMVCAYRIFECNMYFPPLGRGLYCPIFVNYPQKSCVLSQLPGGVTFTILKNEQKICMVSFVQIGIYNNRDSFGFYFMELLAPTWIGQSV